MSNHFCHRNAAHTAYRSCRPAWLPNTNPQPYHATFVHWGNLFHTMDHSSCLRHQIPPPCARSSSVLREMRERTLHLISEILDNKLWPAFLLSSFASIGLRCRGRLNPAGFKFSPEINYTMFPAYRHLKGRDQNPQCQEADRA